MYTVRGVLDPAGGGDAHAAVVVCCHLQVLLSVVGAGHCLDLDLHGVVGEHLDARLLATVSIVVVAEAAHRRDIVLEASHVLARLTTHHPIQLVALEDGHDVVGGRLEHQVQAIGQAGGDEIIDKDRLQPGPVVQLVRVSLRQESVEDGGHSKQIDAETRMVRIS